MKTTIKFALLLAMLCTPVLAGDGNQGSGGRDCDPETEQCGPRANIGGDTGGRGEFDEIFFVVVEEAGFLLGL